MLRFFKNIFLLRLHFLVLRESDKDINKLKALIINENQSKFLFNAMLIPKKRINKIQKLAQDRLTYYLSLENRGLIF